MEQATARRGPRTELGCARTSTNATTHGLTAKGVLLPGEDEAAYVAHLEGVIVSLNPVGGAEVNAAAMIGDLQWRQQRWLRALDVATADDLEKRVTQTPERAAVARIDVALIVLNGMIGALDGNESVLSPVAVDALVGGVNAILPVLREAEQHRTANVAALRMATDALGRADTVDYTRAAIVALRETGVATHSALTMQRHEAMVAVDKVERVLAVAAAPGDDDAKSLTRYGRLIDAAVESQLRVLDALRQRRERTERRAKPQPKSFGQGVTPPELRLRIVR